MTMYVDSVCAVSVLSYPPLTPFTPFTDMITVITTRCPALCGYERTTYKVTCKHTYIVGCAHTYIGTRRPNNLLYHVWRVSDLFCEDSSFFVNLCELSVNLLGHSVNLCELSVNLCKLLVRPFCEEENAKPPNFPIKLDLTTSGEPHMSVFLNETTFINTEVIE